MNGSSTRWITVSRASVSFCSKTPNGGPHTPKRRGTLTQPPKERDRERRTERKRGYVTAPSPRELSVDVIAEILTTVREIRNDYVKMYREGHGESRRGIESGRTGHSDPTPQIVIQKDALRGQCRHTARQLRWILHELEKVAHHQDEALRAWDDPESRRRRRELELPPIATKEQRQKTQDERDRKMNAELESESATRLAERVKDGYVRLAERVVEAS